MMTGGISLSSKVVQITNIAPQATKDQMQSLFGHIGKIEEIRLYPTIRDVSCPVLSRICYVKYYDHSCVAVAQHLTNTVFIDRALIVIPIQNGAIPDEYKALEMATNGTLVPGMHSVDSKLPPEVVNKLEGLVPNQVIVTIDPKLTENNLPEYPPLPVNYDAHKIEETRRTILVYDVRSDWRLEDLMDFLSKAGEVKYGRFAEKGHSTERIKFAMIEFSEQKSVIEVLKMHGTEYNGIPLNLYHSTQPIIKPEAKSNEAAQKEIEEAMSIVKEAQNLISAAIDPVIGMLSKDKGSSGLRSRSRERDRNRRSRSHSRRSRSRDRKRSRSKSKRRSRSRSKRSTSRVKRSRSKSKRSPSRSKRSRSRSKRSKSKDRRRRSRSRSRRRDRDRSPHSRSRKSRSRDRDRKSRSRDRDRDRDHRDRKSSRSHRKEEKHRRTRSRSQSKRRSRSHNRDFKSSREYKSSKRRSRTPEIKKIKRISEEKVIRDYDAEEKIGMERDERSTSIEKSDNMDISNSP